MTGFCFLIRFDMQEQFRGKRENRAFFSSSDYFTRDRFFVM